MKRLQTAGLLAAFVVSLGLPADTPTTSEVAPTIRNQESTATPEASAGYVVHIDEAGNIVESGEPIAPEAMTKDLTDALNQSSAGLVQQASPVPGGGVMVNLQGRFQSGFVATVGADGSLDAPCVTDPAAAALVGPPRPRPETEGE